MPWHYVRGGIKMNFRTRELTSWRFRAPSLGYGLINYSRAQKTTNTNERRHRFPWRLVRLFVYGMANGSQVRLLRCGFCKWKSLYQERARSRCGQRLILLLLGGFPWGCRTRNPNPRNRKQIDFITTTRSPCGVCVCKCVCASVCVQVCGKHHKQTASSNGALEKRWSYAFAIFLKNPPQRRKSFHHPSGILIKIAPYPAYRHTSQQEEAR